MPISLGGCPWHFYLFFIYSDIYMVDWYKSKAETYNLWHNEDHLRAGKTFGSKASEELISYFMLDWLKDFWQCIFSFVTLSHSTLSVSGSSQNLSETRAKNEKNPFLLSDNQILHLLGNKNYHLCQQISRFYLNVKSIFHNYTCVLSQ